MTRFLTAILAALVSLAFPARADQIDAILHYSSLAAAQADPVIQAHSTTDDQGQLQFDSDRVIPDVKVWRASQDNADGSHNYLPGYYLLVSLPRVLPILYNSPAVVIVIDRDLANARQPGAILKRPGIAANILQDIRLSPVFAGADYPWGAWQ